MICAPNQSIGPFVAGEKPDALQYQFQDAAGAPIDLTGYTAQFQWQPEGTAQLETVAVATITDPVNGTVQHDWSGLEFATAGTYRGEFWVGNGSLRYASTLIRWTVRNSIGPAPAI